MQIGIIGLGRMGANIGRRLMSKGHKVVGFDREPKAVTALEGADRRRDRWRTWSASLTRPAPSG